MARGRSPSAGSDSPATICCAATPKRPVIAGSVSPAAVSYSNKAPGDDQSGVRVGAGEGASVALGAGVAAAGPAIASIVCMTETAVAWRASPLCGSGALQDIALASTITTRRKRGSRRRVIRQGLGGGRSGRSLGAGLRQAYSARALGTTLPLANPDRVRYT